MVTRIAIGIAAASIMLIFHSAGHCMPDSHANPKTPAELSAEMMDSWFAGDKEKCTSILKSLEDIIPTTTDPIEKSKVQYFVAVGHRQLSLNAADRVDQIKLSIAHLEKAIELSPDFAEAHALLASCYRILIGMGKAEREAFHLQVSHRRKAYELAPENPRVLMLEALALISIPENRGGNIQEGLACACEAAARLEFENSEIGVNWAPAYCWHIVAMANKKLDRNKDAIACYKKALELQPNWKQITEQYLPELEQSLNKEK